jgi:hypothetical protein
VIEIAEVRNVGEPIMHYAFMNGLLLRAPPLLKVVEIGDVSLSRRGRSRPRLR